MRTWVLVHVRACTCGCVYMYMLVHVRVHVHACTCACLYMYTRSTCQSPSDAKEWRCTECSLADGAPSVRSPITTCLWDQVCQRVTLLPRLASVKPAVYIGGLVGGRAAQLRSSHAPPAWTTHGAVGTAGVPHRHLQHQLLE